VAARRLAWIGARPRLLFLVLTRVVAGTQVSGISFSVLDSNSTAAAPGEVPASLSIGFTATSTGTSLATINLPSGFLSDGNMNIGGGRRLEEDDSDFGGSAAQRRLAAVCEAYGTATVSSNVLTVPVRKVGTASTPCDTAGAAISMVLTAGTASFSSLGTGQLDFTVPEVQVLVPTWRIDASVGDSRDDCPLAWKSAVDLRDIFRDPGPSIDFQWFDRFMVTGKDAWHPELPRALYGPTGPCFAEFADGGEYVDIRVRRHVPGCHGSTLDGDDLDIKMSGRPIRRRGVLHRSQLFSAGDQVKVGVGSRDLASRCTVNPPRLHHTPVLEFVMAPWRNVRWGQVESDSISFMVHASHAGAEFPDDFDKQEWFQGHFATNLARPTTNTRSRGHADRSKQEGNGSLHCHGVNGAEQLDSIWPLPRYQMRLLFIVSTALAAGQRDMDQVSGISFAVLDSNNTAAAPGEARGVCSSSFANRFHCHQHWNRPGDWAPTQALNLKAKETPNHGRDADDDVGDVPEATINLPSGFLSDGNMNIGGGRRLEVDESDYAWPPRRLAAVCEAYGTATVSSNVLTVRKVGTASTPCDTAGAAISMVLTANTASFSSLGTGQLDFTVPLCCDFGDFLGQIMQTDVDNTPVSVTFTVGSSAQSQNVDNSGSFTLSAVGDPITWYQGFGIFLHIKYDISWPRRSLLESPHIDARFWFEPGELMPMLETPEMTVTWITWLRKSGLGVGLGLRLPRPNAGTGAVPRGPTIDFQWFDRFMVTAKDGKQIVDVTVRRALPGTNRTQFRPSEFTQLDIKMGGRNQIRRRGQELFAADGVKVGVGARAVNPPRLHHTPVLEFVMVESESISFMVHAAHAGAEFPDDFDQQVKNTHLDWVNLDMVDPKKNGFKGILPQIWRVQPRTPEVEAGYRWLAAIFIVMWCLCKPSLVLKSAVGFKSDQSTTVAASSSPETSSPGVSEKALFRSQEFNHVTRSEMSRQLEMQRSAESR
ncbi:unnamed protein product, partial [Cladocopium goreaui]